MLPILKTRSFLPDFFDEFIGDDYIADIFGKKSGVNIPSVNVIEGKDDFRIEVAAPGLEKDDFKIEFHNNLLVISSEKEEKKEEVETKFMRREFSYTSFKRSFSLPNSVESDKINAVHKNGILTVNVPKREEAKVKAPRSIYISWFPKPSKSKKAA